MERASHSVDQELQQMIINSVFRDRTIYICEEVTRESMFKAVYYLNRLKSKDEAENIDMKDRLPIKIVLDCYGGYVDHGLALMSTIEHFKSLGYDIITQCNSVAHSMGFMILIMGSHRKMLKYGRTMFHQISSGTHGTITAMEHSIEEDKKVYEVIKNIVLENTNISKKELDKIKREKIDLFFDAREALEKGVIDEIIE